MFLLFQVIYYPLTKKNHTYHTDSQYIKGANFRVYLYSRAKTNVFRKYLFSRMTSFWKFC